VTFNRSSRHSAPNDVVIKRNMGSSSVSQQSES
jgi:hypothetical protein